MLGRINQARGSLNEEPHRLRLSFKDKCRSETDLLHRFIAQLNLPEFKIEKVDIWESPVRGDITFSKISNVENDVSRFSYLFRRRWSNDCRRFKVSLSVIQIDRIGLNFCIEYNFNIYSQQDLTSQDMGLDEKIHQMMETSFEGDSNFLVSRI